MKIQGTWNLSIDVKGIEIEENKNMENKGFLSAGASARVSGLRFWCWETLIFMFERIYTPLKNGKCLQ